MEIKGNEGSGEVEERIEPLGVVDENWLMFCNPLDDEVTEIDDCGMRLEEDEDKEDEPKLCGVQYMNPAGTKPFWRKESLPTLTLCQCSWLPGTTQSVGFTAIKIELISRSMLQIVAVNWANEELICLVVITIFAYNQSWKNHKIDCTS